MVLAQSLYEVVNLKCTKTIIHDLLRQHKEIHGSKILLGITKEELIQNLQEAVSNKLIPEDTVRQMVSECEENGDQHIYLYRCTKNRRKYQDGASVANDLFGSHWSKKFPSYQLKEESFVWSDFRIEKNRWVGKIYGHQFRLKKLDEKEEGAKIIRIFEKLEDRIVCTAVWRDPYLEIRVSRDGTGSRREKLDRVQMIWDMISTRISQNDFEKVDLCPVITTLLSEYNDNTDKYSVCKLRLRDTESGYAEFSTQTRGENLFDSTERGSAIQVYLDQGGSSNQLEVHWLPDEKGELFGNNALAVILAGEEDENAIAIRASTTKLGVDYVINQLREIAERDA